MKKKLIVFACTVLLSVSTSFGQDCDYILPGDIDGDCKADLVDLGILVQSWLVNCNIEPVDPLCIPINVELDTMTWKDVNEPGFVGQMSKYETTNDQYCEFLNAALASGDIIVETDNYIYGAAGSNDGTDFAGYVYYDLEGSGFTTDRATNGGAARITYDGSAFQVEGGFGNHPATYVSWYGAAAFCDYYGYRLPTESEWQAVADYDGTFTYGCGTSINTGIANYRTASHPNGTVAVGSVGAPSGYGYEMYDMAGNATEWTDGGYLYGGFWAVTANLCKVSSYFDNSADTTNHGSGFRACR